MPDWSYCTLGGPLFRRGSHEGGRRFVNGFFGLLGRLPQGYRTVDLLGHMEPHESLATRLPSGQLFPSPLVLSPCINPEGHAAAAFSRFGCGGLTFGPISRGAAERPRFRQGDDGELIGTGGAALSLEEARAIVDQTGSSLFFYELDLFAQDDEPLAALAGLIGALGRRAAAFVLTPQRYAELQRLSLVERGALLDTFAELCASAGATPLLGVPLSVQANELDLPGLAARGIGLCLSGAPGEADTGDWIWGGQAQREAAPTLLAAARAHELFTLVDAGSCSPREALALREAGADLIGIGPGLVHTGPALAKRINETFVYVDTSRREREAPIVDSENQVRRPWTWATVLGLSMLVGAVIAGWSALTAVVLPYDEAFLGRTAQQIADFNPRILKFMTHDRITLAGTMVSIGVLYTSLAYNVMRKGHAWAQHVVGASSAVGFFSFFTFLGFGYFDPFHAFVTAVMLQLVIQVIVRPVGPKRLLSACPRLDNDKVWRRGMWSQLIFIVHAGALILAGLTIVTYGVSVVFVPQDISYLGCDAHAIEGFDSQLKSLIAHDRATFGGMLLSGGVALLATSLWSFRQGDRWLFWTYLITILAPYLMTLWVHYDIGYRDHFHLAPVYIGLALLLIGLGLGGTYLLGGVNNPEPMLPPGSEKPGAALDERPSAANKVR